MRSFMMRCSMAWFMSRGSVSALAAAAALAGGAGAGVQDTAARPALSAEDARALLDATTDPTNAPPAERLYNAGVSMYRASEFALARELFAAAAERAKAGVAARSMYNRGTTSYAEALRAMQGAQDAAPAGPPGESESPDPLGETIKSLERSLRELKDAVRADPTDADARANAELAHRVLKDLKQQQQQQQSGDQDQEQNQQQDPQQNQDGDPQESGQGEQPNEREQDGQQDQQQPQDGQQSDSNREGDRKEQSDGKPREEPREESGKEPEPKTEPNPDAKQTNESGEKSAERPKPMTRQEVERLLQRIRDKERARLIERMERERARTQPAPKDW